MQNRRYILKLSCPDRVGIVAAVSGFFAEHKGWIVEAHHHSDADTKRFFMRQEVRAESLPFGMEELRKRFEVIATTFGMDWTLSDTDVPKKVVMLVSRQAHCLDDLLYRWRSGEMKFQLEAVISNHEDSRRFVEWHKVPFHQVAIEAGNRAGGFREIGKLFERYSPDAIVFARFMQILPVWMCEKYPCKIINIHHSFLPSFVGARPYHQAYERGVKYVGATCHYVTSKLDEGPIIEQDAFRTNHAHSVEELIRIGRDVEKAVLARGLRYHLEDRVLMNGNKTVVFA
jgi:formyltetrahydrofolate deformylase